MADERHSEALLADAEPEAVVSPLLERFLGRDGRLAAAMPGFEPREGQERMMRAVMAALATGTPLLVEAGTGTGKSLGYLLPALLSGKRVIVSTGTKTLQDQLWLSQVPFLRDALGLTFSAAVLKGRVNYLCKLLLGQALDAPDLALVHREALAGIAAWAEQTETGDRGELEGDAAVVGPDGTRSGGALLEVWRAVAADGEQCLGRACPHHDSCFLVRARRRAEGADLVIVNHHLLLADLALLRTRDAGLLPAAEALVLDEAHHLEDVAAQAFGEQLSSARFERWAGDFRRALQRCDGLSETRDGLISAFVREVRALWAALGEARGPLARVAGGRLPWAPGALGVAGQEALARCDNLLLTLGAIAAETSATDAVMARLAERADALRTLAWRLLAGEPVADAAASGPDARGAHRPDGALWLEEGPRTLFLRSAPVSVASDLQQTLLARFSSVILTSATLAEGGRFEPVAARLGLPDHTRGLVVPSPFDLARQGLLFVPSSMPDPRQPDYPEAVHALLRALVTLTSGKALLLFTSYRAMRDAWSALAPTWPWPTLLQGEAGKEALLARFRETPDAVLFATQTFWEGVDVPGQALSLLVIDRLPFESPGDPLVEARIQAIRRSGGNPFEAFQLPRAATALRQGLGRLIRHRADRGVAAILDPRLWHARYGPALRAALPPLPLTADLARVEAFWRALQEGPEDPEGLADELTSRQV